MLNSNRWVLTLGLILLASLLLTSCLNQSRRRPPPPTLSAEQEATVEAGIVRSITATARARATTVRPTATPTAAAGAAAAATDTPLPSSGSSAAPPTNTPAPAVQAQAASPAPPTATTAAAVATSTPVPAATATTAPAATATPTATPTFSVPSITFSTNKYSLASGECATLSWTSANINSLYLNNQPVNFNGNQQVCPTVSTEYVLRAVDANGDFFDDIYITVTEPAPTFGFATVSAASVCTGGNVTVEVKVYGTPTGVGLIYGLQGGLDANQVAMDFAGADTWFAFLTVPSQTGTLLLSFRASYDGGSVDSGVLSSISLKTC